MQDAVDRDHAAKLGLTDINAFFTEVIVITVSILNTRQSLTFNIVGKAAVLSNPAILQRLDQCVGVFEFSVDGTEGAALVAFVIGIDKRFQSISCTVVGILTEGIQRIGTEINLIADFAVVDNIQTRLFTPVCVSLGSELDATDKTQRICHSRINGLGLVDPVQSQSQRIFFLIEFHSVQFEVFIHQIQLGIIHIKVGIETHHRLNPCQNTDTLCQLQQEVPGRSVRCIGTGQHIDQVRQLLGDGDLRHVNCEDIRGGHGLIRIHNLIGHIVLSGGVGNFAVPCELLVAAGDLIKVKGVLALLVQTDGKGSGSCGCIVLQSHGNIHVLDTGGFDTGERTSGDGTGIGVAQGKDQVAVQNGNFLAVIQCSNRQFHGLAVNSIHGLAGKIDLAGSNNVHCHGPNHGFTLHQADLHITVSHSSKFTGSSNGSILCVGHIPGCTLRQLCRITGCADALGSDLLLGADGHI